MRKSMLTMILILATVPTVLAGPNMQEGMWEITSTAEMAGVPFTLPATTYNQCINKDDLVPQQQKPQQECELLDNQIDGDSVIWVIRCTTEGGTMISNGHITYHGDSFEGEINITGPQMPGEMKQTISGKRIGECN